MEQSLQATEYPVWFNGKTVNEALFCEEFLREHKMLFTNGAFFTPDGRVTNPLPLRREIYDKLRTCVETGFAKRIGNIVEVLKLEAQVEDFPPEPDRIHVANGTLLLDGTFTEGKPEIVRSRLPVAYQPDAPPPDLWLNFLNGLLYEEDIPTLQEFIGYSLIPSNKGQRMMVIKGNGGEGKSQIGAVLGRIFGSNMKDGSIGKISENRFARADLEHILLCVDDDMQMEALRQTNYVKSIVTAQGKMDLERKGKQSHQGWMFARLMAFSNGDLQSLYDRSDGFYRRQLVLTTKGKPANRVDDPDLAGKLKAEAQGIFLWAFAGLQRLVANNFQFTESDRVRENREAVRRDNNNIFDFMESRGYVVRSPEASISSKKLYEVYRMWCEENSLTPLKSRSFSDAMVANAVRFGLEYCNNVVNTEGRRVRGFKGIQAIVQPRMTGFIDVSECTYVPEEWR
ncbi:MAG: DNA primase [Clostridia bacterium]|nr:DNA primase [Clostridia bacterium]